MSGDDSLDPTRRFSARVADYVKYRPNYPQRVVELCGTSMGLTPASVVADIGSGTGISAELFLKNGNTVYGVEPNPDMRSAAEQLDHGRREVEVIQQPALDASARHHARPADD